MSLYNIVADMPHVCQPFNDGFLCGK